MGKHDKAGFALIVTISMMVLLALLAVGLLSLSTLSLRSSSRDETIRTARSNARLALQVAIGELQKSMGPDTRVSARADILSERQTVAPENSALIGIWNAWSIDPRSPGDYQGRKAGAPSERSGPDGESIPDGGFHRWLVSTADDDDVSDLGFVSNQLSGDSVPLVNAVGSEPNSAPVLAAKIPLIDSDGNIDGQYAWGVFDEGQKAALNSFPDSRQKRTTLESVALQDGLNWDAIEDWKGISALDEAKQRKLLSLATVGFGGVAQPDDFWHDLTPGSSAVLADVTRGGLKTDLSLLFSRTELPEDYELQHVYSRDEKPLVDVPELDGHAYQFPSPDPRWSLLHKFHRVPEEVFGGEADSPRISFNASQSGSTIPFRPNGFTGDDDYHHDLKLAPVIAKAQFIFSMAFGSSGGLRNIQQRMVQDRVTDWKYIANAQIVIEPIITLWNPYDVPMDVSEFRIFLYRMPLALQIQSSSPYFRRKAGYENTPTDFVSVLAGDAASNSTNIGYPLNIAPPAGKTSIELLPGEHRVFSLQEGYNASDIGNNNNNNGKTLDLLPGWTSPSSGSSAGIVANPMHWLGRQPNGSRPRTAEFKIGPNKWQGSTLHFITDQYSAQQISVSLLPSAEELDNFKSLGGQRIDFYLRYGAAVNSNQIRYEDGKSLEHTKVPDFGAIEFEYGSDLEELLGKIPDQEFPRFPIESGDVEAGLSGGHTTVPERKPFAAATLHLKSLMSDDYRSKFPAKTWIHNNPVAVYARAGFSGQEEDFGAHQYELSIQPMQGDWSSNIPEIAPFGDRQQGLGGPSPAPAGGRVFAPFVSLPRVAPASLAQYRHAPLNNSGKQPLQAQVVGNSFAHPLIPRGEVIMNEDSYLDHSFLANQALFDSTFLSTAEGVDDLEAADQGTELLRNQRMRVKLPDQADSLDQYLVADEDYRRSAACLMLDGAFNVNSTSVKAWQAFLTMMNQKELPFLASLEEAVVETLENDSKEAITSRYQFPLDETLGVQFGGPGSATSPAWTGHRRLSRLEIERLAQAVVDEVKLRGPFQSLAEFINRRAEDSELGDEGCLQAAINEAGINEDSEDDDGNAIDIGPASDGQDDYANQDAAKGSSMTGTPGFVTQADLLHTMAPYITPRSDTFRIRAYGSATDAEGRVIVSAWCEAVVQRVPDYVDSSNQAHESANNMDQGEFSEVNRRFGRRFQIESFRWLNPDEIVLQ